MRNTQTPRTDAAETNWWSEDGLRSAFIVRADFARELEREMNQLRKERDEARIWLCKVLAKPEFVTGLAKPGKGRPQDFAKEHGWDCFKEDGK